MHALVHVPRQARNCVRSQNQILYMNPWANRMLGH